MKHLHTVLALAWISLAMAIGIKTALLGNEQTVLSRQRAGDLAKRRELIYQNDRLRARLDWVTSPPVLSETVRRLDLPLQAPVTTARLESNRR